MRRTQDTHRNDARTGPELGAGGERGEPRDMYRTRMIELARAWGLHDIVRDLVEAKYVEPGVEGSCVIHHHGTDQVTVWG